MNKSSCKGCISEVGIIVALCTVKMRLHIQILLESSLGTCCFEDRRFPSESCCGGGRSVWPACPNPQGLMKAELSLWDAGDYPGAY